MKMNKLKIRGDLRQVHLSSDHKRPPRSPLLLSALERKERSFSTSSLHSEDVVQQNGKSNTSFDYTSPQQRRKQLRQQPANVNDSGFVGGGEGLDDCSMDDNEGLVWDLHQDNIGGNIGGGNLGVGKLRDIGGHL